jgi:hypothetical protein
VELPLLGRVPFSRRTRAQRHPDTRPSQWRRRYDRKCHELADLRRAGHAERVLMDAGDSRGFTSGGQAYDFRSSLSASSGLRLRPTRQSSAGPEAASSTSPLSRVQTSYTAWFTSFCALTISMSTPGPTIGTRCPERCSSGTSSVPQLAVRLFAIERSSMPITRASGRAAHVIFWPSGVEERRLPQRAGPQWDPDRDLRPHDDTAQPERDGVRPRPVSE